jgi:phospholipase/lecithinase/hemolysin
MTESSELPTYSAIYAFGDSLSDAGNDSILTEATGVTPASPPYYQEIDHETVPLLGSVPVPVSVFSNGPTWVQDLSVSLGLGTLTPSLLGGNDFAYGGAETGPTPQNGSEAEILAISLPAQLVEFQGLVGTPASGALYTLSIGANDLLDILANPSLTTAQQAADVAAAVANEVHFVNQLVGDGAKNLLVLDVPDLGKTPDVMDGLANGTDTPSAALDTEASDLSSAYNAALITGLGGIASADNVDVTVVNLYQFIDEAVADPAAYGLTNVASPVWSGNYTSASSGTLAASGAVAQDQYLFFDHLHPTETGQLATATLAMADLAQPSAGSTGIVILDAAPSQYEIASAGGTLYVADVGLGGDGTQTLPGVTVMQFTDGTGVFDPTGTAEQVARLYGSAFHRAPDLAGLQNWTSAIDGGSMSLLDVANSFTTSPEFVSDYGSLSNADFVNQLYQNALGRAGDPAGVQTWNGVLAAGASRGAVLLGFAESQEYEGDTISITSDNTLFAAGDNDNGEIYRLYEAALGRAPDPTGQAYWASELASGVSETQVAQGFVGSAEFQSDYGANLSPSAFVTLLYQNVLDRAPDQAGLNAWVGQMQQGMSEASVVLGFSDSTEFRADSAAATHANWVFIPS